RDIVVPLARPGLATIAVWTVVQVWGSFLTPFILLRDPDKQPAAVLVRTFYTEGGSPNLALISTFSVLYSIPVVLMYLVSWGRHHAAARCSRRGHGVPGLRALPAHDRAGQHRVPVENQAPATRAAGGAGGPGGRPARPGRADGPPPGRAVRRAAATGRARAGR